MTRFDTPHRPHVRPRIVSIHNMLGETNIPLEAFLQLAGRGLDLHVASLYQDQPTAADAVRHLGNPREISAHGLGLKWRRPDRLWFVRQWLRALNPDIVHVHHTSSAALFACFMRYGTSAKTVTTVHRDFRTLGRLQRQLFRMAITHSDVVLCNSESTRDSLDLATFARSPKIRVLYNGVNFSDLEAAVDAVRLAEAPVARCHADVVHLGTVGRLIPIKGIDTIIQALARQKAQGRSFRLTIVGGGPDRGQLESLARQHDLSGEVRFTGPVSREAVYQQLAEFDIFVASSHSEGFCNAMVEAMAAGLPVVATDIAVFREILPSGHEQFFTPGCADQLVDCLNRWWNDAAARQRCGDALRKRARQHFSLLTCADRHEALYRSLAPMIADWPRKALASAEGQRTDMPS